MSLTEQEQAELTRLQGMGSFTAQQQKAVAPAESPVQPQPSPQQNQFTDIVQRAIASPAESFQQEPPIPQRPATETDKPVIGAGEPLSKDEVTSSMLPEEQSELDQLQRMQPNPEILSQEFKANRLLVGSLRGRLPSSGQLPVQSTGGGRQFGFGGTGIGGVPRQRNPDFDEEVSRRKAFKSLTDKGFDSQQIQVAIDIQKRLTPGLIQSFKKDIGQTAGGLTGAIAGAKVAAIAGQLGPQAATPEEVFTVPAGAIIGAFIGGGSGKTIQQVIDPLESVSARDFLKAGLTEAAFEAGGRAVVGGFRRLGGQKMAVESVEEAKKRFLLEDGFFQPAQRDNRILVKAADQLSSGSFGGGPIMGAHNITQQGQAALIGEDIIKRIAGESLDDTAVLGDEIAGIFTRLGEKGQQVKGVRQTLLDTFFDDLYNQVDVLSSNAQFTTAPIKKLAKKKLEQDIKQGGALLTSEGRSRLKGIVKTLEDVKTAGDMRQLRSSYAKDARRFQVGGDQSSVIFSELAEAADGILFDAGSQAGLSEPARKLLRNINAVYGPSKQLYNETIIKEIVRKLNTNPSLVNTLIGKKPDPKNLKLIRDLLVSPVRKTSGSGQSTKTIVKELRAAKSALKNPQAKALLAKNASEGKRLWRQLKAGWLKENIINPSTGLIDAKQMDKAIRGMDQASFRMMFPGDIGKDLKALNGLVDVISPKNQGIATLFGKGIEFGGFGSLGAGLAAGNGISIASGGAMVIGPTAYAKIATNPKATKLLTLGLKRQAKGKAVNIPALAARIINVLGKQDATEQKAIRAEQRRILAGPRKGRSPSLEELRGFGGRGY